jgi:cell division protein FtsQ
MNHWKDNLLLASQWALSLAALGVTLGFAYTGSQQAVVQTMHYQLNDGGMGFLVIQEDLEKVVLKAQGECVGLPVQSINTGLLEERVEAHPLVENAEVFSTLNGEVFIDVTQRKPVARIFEPNGKSYYLDNNGLTFPLSERHAAAVPLVLTEGRRLNTQISHRILTQWEKNEFLQGTLTGLRTGPKGLEIELRNLKPAIVLGDTTQLNAKLQTLTAFLRKGPSMETLNQYLTIDLRYNQQAVCTKPD